MIPPTAHEIARLRDHGLPLQGGYHVVRMSDYYVLILVEGADKTIKGRFRFEPGKRIDALNAALAEAKRLNNIQRGTERGRSRVAQ